MRLHPVLDAPLSASESLNDWFEIRNQTRNFLMVEGEMGKFAIHRFLIFLERFHPEAYGKITRTSRFIYCRQTHELSEYLIPVLRIQYYRGEEAPILHANSYADMDLIVRRWYAMSGISEIEFISKNGSILASLEWDEQTESSVVQWLPDWNRKIKPGSANYRETASHFLGTSNGR